MEEDDMGRACDTCGKEDVQTGLWLGKLRERTLGRHKHRWEDNIKIKLKSDMWVWVIFICLIRTIFRRL
jgi:hypothetical protein